MMAEILNDPIKTVMLAILVPMEIVALITLITLWKKAKKTSEGSEA